MTIPEQAVQAEILWAVNIHGPDDLVAAPDYLSAVRMSNAFNAWWLNLKMKQPHNDAIDARMWAVPTDWPENYAQEHAYELSKPHPEYQWLRDASAAPHLAAVRVKKLEWKTERADKMNGVDTERNGFHEFGYYSITGKSSGCFVSTFDNMGRVRHVDPRGFGSIDAAKAAAQADYEARILSALEPSAGRAAVLEEAARVVDAKAEEYEKEARDLRGSDRDRRFCSAVAVRLRGSANEIRAVHPVADKPDEAGAQGEGWLPIESAPNNKAILVHYDDGNIELISSDDNMFSWIAYTAKEDFCTKPTHWRPLPTPPSGEVA